MTNSSKQFRLPHKRIHKISHYILILTISDLDISIQFNFYIKLLLKSNFQLMPNTVSHIPIGQLEYYTPTEKLY